MSNVTIKDYQDWLKNNSKAKVPKEGEELSAYDEQANRTLYNQYVKQAELLNQKNEAEARVQAQKESALRDNYIAQAQAQKKAEDAVKMQGVATGVSESGLIDLYAQGAAARAGIINASDSAKNDIFSEYRRAIAESNAETNAALAEIDANRGIYEEEQKAKDNANAVNAFAFELEKFNSDNSDFEELKNAYEKFGASLDEAENHDLISQYQNALKDNNDAETIESERKLWKEKYGVSIDKDSIASAENAGSEWFGTKEKRVENLKEQISFEASKGNIKSGEVVEILFNGIPNATYRYFYKDGNYYKIPTVSLKSGSMVKNGKDIKVLSIYDNGYTERGANIVNGLPLYLATLQAGEN